MVLIVWFLNFPAVYINKNIEEVRRFLYILLYRGYAEESIVYNGVLSINTSHSITSKHHYVEIGKHKVKGEHHLIFSYWIKKDEEITKIYEYESIEKYEKFIRKVMNNRFIEIDFGKDVDELISFITFFWKNIFKDELLFYMGLGGDIELKPNKFVYGESTEELEKMGIRIDLPIKKWQWLLWKIKNPRGKLWI
jgi:hypothetical protein